MTAPSDVVRRTLTEHRRQFWQRVRDDVVLSKAERYTRMIETSDGYRAAELLNQSFGDPMFAQLVESPSAKARAAFVTFMREQPIPRHREWLTKLTTDSGNTVRTAAAQAIQDLKKQFAEPPPVRKRSPPTAKVGDVTFEEPPLEAPKR